MKKWISVLLLMVFFCFSTTVVHAGGDKKIKNGRSVKFDYTLTVQGDVVDSTKGREPLEYVHGQDQILKGLEKRLRGLKKGDERTFTVPAKEGYGAGAQVSRKEVNKDLFPEDVELSVGMVIPLQNQGGQNISATVSEVKEDVVVLTFDHPLAGQDLVYAVKIIDVN